MHRKPTVRAALDWLRWRSYSVLCSPSYGKTEHGGDFFFSPGAKERGAVRSQSDIDSGQRVSQDRARAWRRHVGGPIGGKERAAATGRRSQLRAELLDSSHVALADVPLTATNDL